MRVDLSVSDCRKEVQRSFRTSCVCFSGYKSFLFRLFPNRYQDLMSLIATMTAMMTMRTTRTMSR